MAITVYLSNTDIIILAGSGNGKTLKITKGYSAEVPEGTILNGVITDPEMLTDSLKELWATNKLPKKGINVSVNSPHIAVRVMDIPLLNKAKTLEYLRREFIDDDTKVLGFFRLSANKSGHTAKVLVQVAETSYVEDYVQVFEDAGIEIGELNSGIGGVVNLLHKTAFAKGKNCVVCLRDDMTVTSIFFVNGEYFYSTSSRTFNDCGSLEFAQELSNTILQIDQFARSQHVEEPITDVYLSGMVEDDAINAKNSIGLSFTQDINVELLRAINGVSINPSVGDVEKLLYPAAGITPQNEQVNILKSVERVKGGEKLKKQQKIIKLAIPYAAVLLVMFIITGVMLYSNLSKKKTLKELQDYNNNPANLMSVAEYDADAAQAVTLGQHYSGMNIMEEYLNSYPSPGTEVINRVQTIAKRMGSLTVKGYDSTTGELSIDASFSDMDTINKFVRQLNKEDLFYSVSYQGYTKDDANNVWVAHISLVLSENAGKDVSATSADTDTTADSTDDTTGGDADE